MQCQDAKGSRISGGDSTHCNQTHVEKRSNCTFVCHSVTNILQCAFENPRNMQCAVPTLLKTLAGRPARKWHGTQGTQGNGESMGNLWCQFLHNLQRSTMCHFLKVLESTENSRMISLFLMVFAACGRGTSLVLILHAKSGLGSHSSITWKSGFVRFLQIWCFCFWVISVISTNLVVVFSSRRNS